MSDMVQISREMLKDINGALIGYWGYLASDTRKAKYFGETDKENYYRAAAGKIAALTDDIAAMFDPKE